MKAFILRFPGLVFTLNAWQKPAPTSVRVQFCAKRRFNSLSLNRWSLLEQEREEQKEAGSFSFPASPVLVLRCCWGQRGLAPKPEGSSLTGLVSQRGVTAHVSADVVT